MASKNEKPFKRKHKVLSVEDKLTIINRLEQGETGASLAKIYNVGRATIFDIKSKKNKLLKFASKFNCKNGSKKRKTMKKVGNEQLENALYSWYLQMRNQGEHITGPLLCARALQLNQIYEGSPDFRASSGWLRNFKSRYGIGMKELEIQGDNSPADFPAANCFNEYVQKVAEGESLAQNVVTHWFGEESKVNIKKEHESEEEIINHDNVDLVHVEQFIDESESNPESEKESLSGPTHAEAFVALETAMEWCEEQSECSTTEIRILKKLKDLAAKKHKLGWNKTKKNTNIKNSR